jgi:hypothetical protein
LIRERETCRTGCEVLHVYVNESGFSAEGADLRAAAEALGGVVIAWRGAIREANEGLHAILVRMAPGEIARFFEAEMPRFAEVDVAEARLAVMRGVVAPVVDRAGQGDVGILRVVLRFVVVVQNNEETRMPAEKALEVLRHAVDPEAFNREWTEILAEAEERRQREAAEREVDAELEPDALKARIAEERRRKKIEERKKRWWASTGDQGTLHAFGEDGLPVAPLPLAKEFQ